MLSDVRAGWRSVRTFQEWGGAQLGGPSRSGAPSHRFRNFAHSLILLFAFSVFEDVLKQLRDEGVFTCQSSLLGRLMQTSHSVLPWVDFDVVDGARRDRNEIAHEQRIIKRATCWEHVDAIEAELTAWEVL